MTDKTDIAALRKAALKATPGDWKIGFGSTYAYAQASIDMKLGGRSWVKLSQPGHAGWCNQQNTIDDAKFIAMANPATIIAILDQLEAAHQRVEELKDQNQRAGDFRRNETIAALQRAEKAEAENASLKGEQVPVAWKINSEIPCHNVVTVSEVVAKSWIDKGRSVTPLFGAPPKPTINKQKFYYWLEDNFDIADSQRDALAADFAYCCDCIVKAGG